MVRWMHIGEFRGGVGVVLNGFSTNPVIFVFATFKKLKNSTATTPFMINNNKAWSRQSEYFASESNRPLQINAMLRR